MKSEQNGFSGVVSSVARGMGIAVVIALLVGFVVAQTKRPVAAKAEPKADVVRGTVVTVEPQAIVVKDRQGQTRRVAVERNTLVMSDEEDFSMASLPDIELSVKDLAAGDAVEVVVEPDQKIPTAGIVTRLTSLTGTEVARSASPRRH
jgi:hypothetical protein